MKKFPLKSNQKRIDFLHQLGFEQTKKGEPLISMGTLVSMEVWKMWNDYNVYQLYIHFDESESGYCNLYYGADSDNPEIFSYRNLISELKKRFENNV